MYHRPLYIIHNMEQLTEELLQKTIGEMSAVEFIQLIKVANDEKIEDSHESDEDKYVYGIAGIAELFHCSMPTANRIKKSGRIKKAITQIGRKIVVDKKMALELAGQPTFHRRGA